MKFNLSKQLLIIFGILVLTSCQFFKNSAFDVTQNSEILAKLENDDLKITFQKHQVNDKVSVSTSFELSTSDGWFKVPSNSSAEAYAVILADTTTTLDFFRSSYPKWKASKTKKDKSENDLTKVIWEAGENHIFTVKTVTQVSEQQIALEFYPSEIGILKAIWELKPGNKTAKVTLDFTPKESAQYSLGYFIPNSLPKEEADALLMPMLIQQKRFPKINYTQLQGSAPTPVSIMQTTSDKNVISWGVSGEPTEVPYEFPVPIKSHYGLHIKNDAGKVQPSIFGPVLGTEKAKFTAGETVSFSFRVFAQNNDWYHTYRDIADTVFGLYDYRENGIVSMTASVYNMIDLYMDDDYGGWWDKAKANYQIESKNGSTQSSPLTTVSLYKLTGNDNLYHKRTLPSLEYILSRDNPHFSPFPKSTGGYNRGAMKGPVDIFGTTVYGGIWEMMNYRTPIFKDISLPNGKMNLTKTQQSFIPHVQPFDEWLGAYLMTKDKKHLEKSIELADSYIESYINREQEKNIPLREFFLMAYTPDWEGLLRLFEITGKRRFLEAAEKGARLTMTGMWTQPMPKNEPITIHKNNVVHGDKMDRWLHKGEEEFRLGYPRNEGDVVEKEVPAWLVSNVGLGFEQPTTYTYKDNGGRMILQSNWTGGFLRLAHYTGDKNFEMYARNAAIGRSGNYAGYYYTTFSDLQQNPRYPYEGPDVGFVYYHHLPVHLSWTIDYLVSEALLASNGAIKFPGLRQFGYAYFDNMVYGHKPGKIFGQDEVWLWFDKNLIDIDNSQINYLTAHTNDKFYLILMNESKSNQQADIKFNLANITNSPKRQPILKELCSKKNLQLDDEGIAVNLKPRGLQVLELGNLNIDVKTHREYEKPKNKNANHTVEIDSEDGTKIKATSIQILEDAWSAYVYSTADYGELNKIVIHWRTNKNSGVLVDTDYPYEFSIPLTKAEDKFTFTVEIEKSNASRLKTDEAFIKK